MTNELFERVCKHRNRFHRFPELSFEEYKTQKYILETLARLGIEAEQCTDTGVVATVGQGDRCVALRADIDALPIEEETDFEFKSEHPGIMHACGHDMHAAMLLGAAEYLKKNESKLTRKVKLIFQPGEEMQPGGAKKMIEAGVLENPVPDLIYGLHIYPETDTGTISLAEGPVMASTNEIYITVHGEGCHAARPHLGKDPVLASAALINYYQSIITKFRNPIEPAVLTIASIDGRSVINAIPDKVTMKGVIRTFSEKVKRDIVTAIEAQSPKIAGAYGCTFELDTVWGYPVLINESKATERAKEIAVGTVEEVNVLDFEPKMWAEDFARYTEIIPGAFIFVGAKPARLDSMPGLHNSKMLPDEEALKTGTDFLINLALRG